MRHLQPLRLLLWSLLHLGWCVPASAQCAVEWLPGDAVPGVATSGSNCIVTKTLMWDPDGAGPAGSVLVMAGVFTVAGNVVAKNIATWDPISGVCTPLGSGIEGDVYTLAVLQNGDLVAGGSITSAGGVAANNIARWNGTSWTTLGSGTNGLVRSLTLLANGTLVACGSFTTAGGVPCPSLATWNGASWAAPAASISGEVYTVGQMPNGELVVGGAFTMIQGVAANNIARWDGTAWWPLGSGMNSAVSALHSRPNGELVAAGGFSTAGGTAAAGMARWNGLSWAAMGAGLQSIIAMVTLPNGDLAVGGIPAGYVQTWNGTAWTQMGGLWNGFLNGAVWALTVLPNGELTAAGDFTLAGGYPLPVVPTSRLARFGGTTWSALVAGTNGSVTAMTALPNGDVVAVGGFRSTGGVLTNRVAQWNGTSWSALGSGMVGMNDELRAVVTMPNGDVVAGGNFGMAGGVLVNNIARWNGSTWAPLGSGVNSLPYVGAGVRSMTVLPNGDLIVGGYFTMAGGVPCNHIARWNGTSWSALGAGFNAQVFAVVTLPNGDVVAGGYFSTAGTVAANRVARWDGTAWSALGTSQFGPGGNSTPLSLAVMPNGDVVAGGYFYWLGGVYANSIARWNGVAWSPLGPGVYGDVNSLTVLPNGDLVAGGRFLMAGIVTANRVARWDGAVWSALDTGTDAEVFVVKALADGSVLAGGRFAMADNQVSAGFARLVSTCPATAVSFGSGCAGSGGANTLSATSLPWTGSTFRAVATGMPANGFAVAVLGFSSGSAPLQTLLPQGQAGCSLLVSPDLLEIQLPSSGMVATSVPIPNNVALVGLNLHQQIVPFEFDLAGNLTAVTSSNALTLTIGTF